MILMAPCIIDFMGRMHYLGQWGGGGPGHSWALKWHLAKRVPFGPRSVQGMLSCALVCSAVLFRTLLCSFLLCSSLSYSTLLCLLLL
jgi:hypothetical protein